jgi:hypothetical protein
MTISPGQLATAEDVNAALAARLSVTGGEVVGPLRLTGLPQAQSDGSAPVGAVTGDLYINGGFVCIAP